MDYTKIKGRESSFIRNVFIILFFITQFFMATIGFGGISFRIYALLLMLVYAFHDGCIKHINKCFKYYIFYLAFYVIICAINGDIITPDFSKNMLSYHILSIATYLVFISLIKNGEELKLLKLLVVALCIVNSIITILQFHNNPIGWAIGNFFGVDVEGAAMYLDAHGNNTFLNAAFAGGINGNAVVNGYFMASFFPIMTVDVWSTSKTKQVFGYIMVFFGIYTIYCIQQRMALICVMLYVLYIIYKKLTSSRLFIILCSLVLLFYMISDFSISNYDLGRLSAQTDNTARLTLIDGLINFLDNGEIVFGGFASYLKSGYQGQHNTFFDVLTRAGFFGLFVFLVYFYQTLKFVKNAYSQSHDPLLSSLCVSVILYVIYSQTHSTGIQSGITFYWFIIAMIDLCKRYSNVD